MSFETPSEPPSVPTPPIGYPIQLSVTRPEKQSRLTNFPPFIGTFIRVILAVPHLAILYALQIAASVLYFIATFAILFSGRYPAGMYKFVAGYLRWNAYVMGYMSHLYDGYPPFSMDPQPEYNLSLE